MIKRLTLSIIMLITFLFLTSCSFGSESDYYLKKLEKDTGIQHMSDAKIEFFYKNISGFDSSGVLYFVLKFEEEPIEFFNQFEHEKAEEFEKFHKGRNIDFEEKVDSLITRRMEDDYNDFDDIYKINWNINYLYKNDSPSYVTLPMIYYEESYRLIIVKLQM